MFNNRQLSLCDATQLKPGDWLSRISYMKVVDVKDDGKLKVRNEHGYEWFISPEVVEAECRAANQFTKTVEITQTQLAEKIKSAGHLIFTVEFEEQPQLLEQKLTTVVDDDLRIVKKRRMIERNRLNRTPRTLVGYLKQSDPHMDRSIVRDLEISEKNNNNHNNEHKVDHRKINYIIIDNVRYQTKK